MINDLIINESLQTPEVRFKKNGKLFIGGVSSPDNVFEFFNPLFDWIKEYVSTNPKSVELEMFFDYLNTSSTRVLVELMTIINDLKKQNIAISFVWKYEKEDEDMCEFGEDLETVTKTKIEYKPVTVD